MKYNILKNLLANSRGVSQVAASAMGCLMVFSGWSQGIALTEEATTPGHSRDRQHRFQTLAQTETRQTNLPKSDIEGYWAQSCIQRLSQRGTVSGYPDNTFRPNSPITRAEYAALLNQAFPDIAAQREAPDFVDVPESYWGQEAIQTAYRKGFLSGYPSQEFRPNELVSRVETFVALASGLNYAAPDNVQGILAAAYGDAAAIPAYATEEIAALTQQGAIVKPTADGNSLNPAEPATRGQVAGTLCQLKFEDDTLPAGYVMNPVENPDDAVVLGQTCSNRAANYTVNYPTGWVSNAGDVLNSCQVFDPTSITLPERSSSFNEAIHLRIDSIPFEEVADTDDITETILTRRDTTVDGYEAIIEESESTGRALLPEGVRSYAYIINLGDGEIMVASTYDIANQQYTYNKKVLDQMVSTLRFNR
jgi:hypothetical protein